MTDVAIGTGIRMVWPRGANLPRAASRSVPDFHLAGGGMLTALPVTAGHSNIRLPPAA
jgi:hypothetical protein